MRAQGEADRALGFGPSDHLCWGYRTRAELERAAVEWLGEGARLGQRLAYVADRTAGDLAADLAGLDDRDALIADGSLLLFGMHDLYDLSAPIDAESQLQSYAAAVAQAIADGYLGLRVVADITGLVADPSRRPSHLHWEHHADRWMAHNPLAALCAYDVDALGPDAAPIACVHPVRHVPPDLAPFALFAGDGGRLVLRGEVDAFAADTLEAVLAALPKGGDAAVDASGLDFLDGKAASVVATAAALQAEDGGSLRLVGSGPGVHALWSALGLDPAVLAA